MKKGLYGHNVLMHGSSVRIKASWDASEPMEHFKYIVLYSMLYIYLTASLFKAALLNASIVSYMYLLAYIIFEIRHEKTFFLHMQKQRCRSAVR